MMGGLFLIFSLLLIVVLTSVISSTILSSAQDESISMTQDSRDAISTVPSDRYTKALPLYYGDISARSPRFLFTTIVDATGGVLFSTTDTAHATAAVVAAYPSQDDTLSFEAAYEGHRAIVVCVMLNESEETYLFAGYSLEAAYHDVMYARIMVTGAILTLCAIFIVVSCRMGCDIFERIKELSYATQTIAEGNLSHRVPVKGNDELSRVMELFNNMAERRMDDEAHLRLLNTQLKMQNDELDSFARDLYHDSQTPLSTIGGYLSVLEDAIASNDTETIQHTTVIIREAAKSLSDSHRQLGNRIRNTGPDRGE